MAYAGVALIVAGSILGLVSSILLLVAGFRVSVGWGIALLFIPGLAALLFLVLHWPEARAAFLAGLAAFVLVGGGAVAFAGGVNPQALLDARVATIRRPCDSKGGGPYR